MVQIVKFKNANEPQDMKARMYVIEDRGETLLVKDLHPYSTPPSTRIVMKDAVENGLGFLGNTLLENIQKSLLTRCIPMTEFFDDFPLDYSNITLDDLEALGEHLDIPVAELFTA